MTKPLISPAASGASLLYAGNNRMAGRFIPASIKERPTIKPFGHRRNAGSA